jgi:hypothetical protein
MAVDMVRRSGLASGRASYVPQSDGPVEAMNHDRKWREQEGGYERLGAHISATPNGRCRVAHG